MFARNHVGVMCLCLVNMLPSRPMSPERAWHAAQKKKKKTVLQISAVRKRKEFIVRVRHPMDAQSQVGVQVEAWDSSAVLIALTCFVADECARNELLCTHVAFMAPCGHCVRQWVRAFLTLFLDRLS